MNKYHGTIKTVDQAKALAKKLRKTGDKTAEDTAAYIEANPHRFLARPEIQPPAIALSQIEPIDVERKGSVLNGIMRRNGIPTQQVMNKKPGGNA